MTVQWIHDALPASPAVVVNDELKTVFNYIGDARAIAAFTTSTDAQRFSLKSATPQIVEAKLTTATVTTTVAARRQLVAGAAASTGGFTTAESWCLTLKDSTPNSIYCVSDASSTTLSFLQDAEGGTCTLGAQDITALTKLSTFYVDLTPTISVAFQLQIKATLTANKLCDALTAAGILNVASCRHDAVTIATGRRARKLEAQSLEVKLCFLTQGDLSKVQAAYDAINWAENATFSQFVTGEPGALTVTGGTLSGGSGAPGSPGVSTAPTSAAAIRLVGVVLLAVFVAA